MIEEAAGEFGIDLKGSFVIGDKLSDIEAGCRVGCQTVLLEGEGSLNRERGVALIYDYVAAYLYEAVEWLLKFSRQKG